jgi:hemerythrin
MTFKKFDSEGVVVLLIDDDRTTMMLLSKVVVAMGATALTALNGAEGLIVAHERKPAVVICDYHMTPVGGASFLAGLRNSSEADVSKIPVIMFTAETDETTMAKLNLLGATKCIAKPFNPKGLSQTLYAVTEVCPVTSLAESPDFSGLPDAQGWKDPGLDSLPEWSQEMSVGNDTLDADHKAFFELARNIAEALHHKDDSHFTIASSVNMLVEYVAGHFYREENALRALGYNNLAQHHHKHRMFQGRIQAIAEAYQQGTSSVADNLPNLVIEWLRQHIMVEDMQYKRWMRDSAVDNRPLGLLALEAEDKHSA